MANPTGQQDRLLRSSNNNFTLPPPKPHRHVGKACTENERNNKRRRISETPYTQDKKNPEYQDRLEKIEITVLIILQELQSLRKDFKRVDKNIQIINDNTVRNGDEADHNREELLQAITAVVNAIPWGDNTGEESAVAPPPDMMYS